MARPRVSRPTWPCEPYRRGLERCSSGREAEVGGSRGERAPHWWRRRRCRIEEAPAGAHWSIHERIMTLEFFFQLALNGVVVGSIYALVALGFVIIYKS